MRKTLKQLEEENKYLNEVVRGRDMEIAVLKERIKVLGVGQQVLTSLSIACEKTTESMAHIVGDVLRLRRP